MLLEQKEMKVEMLAIISVHCKQRNDKALHAGTREGTVM